MPAEVQLCLTLDPQNCQTSLHDRLREVSVEPWAFVANCSILFTEYPLLRRAEAAHLAGFAEVEFWWPFPNATPTSFELDEFVTAIERAQVRVTGLNYYGGNLAGGQRGILADPARTDEFRETVRVAHRLGERVGCRSFNALYGVRSKHSVPEDRTAHANLQYALDRAADGGAKVLLEPLSDVAGYPLRTITDVRDVIDAAGSPPHLGLQSDLYHLAANGVDLDEALDAVPITGHVQVADYPGRGEPGSGSLPLGEFLHGLRARGYDGRVALEYVPTGSTVDSLAALSALNAHFMNTPGGE
jgi:hydroxypyruvate isomerase